MSFRARKLRLLGSVSAGGGGDPLPNPDAGGVADLVLFAPLAVAQTVYRTMLVGAGDEVVDLSRECLHPGSPQANLYQVSGASAANWKQDSVGLLTAVVANRAAMKGTTQTLNVKAMNGNGWGNEVVLTIRVVADADARFVDFEGGADANDGLTPGAAKKRIPGSYGYTGSAMTIDAGKVVFLKSSSKHRYTLTSASSAQGSNPLAHTGSSGNPVVYSGTGWGSGMAKVWGDDVEVGSVSTVTQAEVGGNPNYANIRKITLSSPILAYQRFFVGNRMFNPAQFPQPLNPRLYSNPLALAANTMGMYNDLTMTSSSGTSPRAYQTGGAGGTITWVDARLAARYGNVASAVLEGKPAIFWTSGNFIGTGVIASYDYATSTITITPSGGAALYDATTGVTSIGLTLQPADINEAGQYATSADGNTVYFWYEAGEISVSRRTLGAAHGTSYSMFRSVDFSRFGGTGNGSGSAIALLMSGTKTQAHIIGCKFEHSIVYDGGGLVPNTNGSWLDSNFELNTFGFNPYSGGFRCGTVFSASEGSTLTEAQVIALAYGKWRNNYFEPNALQGSSTLFVKTEHMEMTGNVWRESISTHGGGLKFYTDSAPAYVRRCAVFNNAFLGLDRCMAFSGHDDDRSNWFRRNIYLGDASKGANYPVGRDPGCERSGEIMAFIPGGAYPYAYFQSPGLNADQFRGCVVAGMSRGTLASCNYDVQNCYFPDTSVLENDGANRVFANNEVEAGTVEWDWRTAAMPTKWHNEIRDNDGAGAIGVYWTIAA